jgi:hypothetical protein
MTLQISRRRPSRGFLVALGAAAVVGLALLTLWLARASVTEWAIERAIDGFGLGPSEVRVTAVGFARAELSLVSSAAGTVDHIHVEYELGDLLGGEVRRMTVEGARIRFAWKDGRLVPAITPSAGPIRLPLQRLDIRNSTLTLAMESTEIVADVTGTVTGMGAMGADLAVAVRAPDGHLTGRVTGTMAPDGALDGTFAISGGDVAIGSVRASTLTGRLHLVSTARGVALVDGAFGFEQIASGGRPLGPGRLSATLRRPQNVLTVALQSAPVSFSFQADGAAPKAGVPFTMEGTADAGFLSGLANTDQPATGGLHLSARGTAPPADTLQAAAAAGLGDWLRQGKAEGALEATVAGLRLPETVSVEQAGLSIAVTLADGSLAVTAPKGISITGMSLDRSLAPPGSLFAGRSSFSLAAASSAPFLSVTPDGGSDRVVAAGGIRYDTPSLSLRGDLAVKATLDPAQWLAAARDKAATGELELKANVALKLPQGRALPSAELAATARYDVGPDATRLVADSTGFSLRDAQLGDGLSLPGLSRLALKPGATAALDRKTGAVEVSAALQPLAWTVRMRREAAEPETVTVAAAGATLDLGKDGLRASLDRGRIAAPGAGVAATGITATILPSGAETVVKATIGDLRGTGEPALFAPLKATLDARIAGDRTSFSGSVTGAGKLLSVAVRGTHDLGAGKGSAGITLNPLVLSGPETLARLSPSLAAGVTEASGTIGGGGTIYWGDGARPGTFSVTLKDGGLRTESFRLSGVNGALRLDSLTPPVTPAGQRITGTLELPFDKPGPFDVTFRLEPGKLVVEKASARMFEGEVSTENAELDAGSGDGRVDLKISDMNLSAAFGVLDLEQLKGTGRIGGVLPLRVEGGKVSVAKGHLESSMPGTLQVGVQTLADQLQTYGENVDMAFRALTDFHYQRMTIDADKPLSGAGKAMFRLEGNNPAVMDGQPFIFNISLETDFDYLTRLLLELSGTANKALGWGAQELTRK